MVDLATSQRLVLDPRVSPESPPSWSPDGGQIAYITWTLSGAELRVVGTDGQSETAVVAGRLGVDPSSPAWSPDGTWIAYGISGLVSGLMVARPDGSENRRLTSPEETKYDAYPAWSPDGAWVAFSRTDMSSSDGELWIVSADATEEHLLVLGPWAGARWRPGG